MLYRTARVKCSEFRRLISVHVDLGSVDNTCCCHWWFRSYHPSSMVVDSYLGIHMVLLYVLSDNVNFLPSQPVTVRYMFRRHFPKCGRLFTEYMTVFTLLAARVTCQDNYLVNLKSFIPRIVVYILSYVCHAFLRIHILTYGTCLCIYYHLW